MTYVKGEQEEQQLLTPNTILWRRNVYSIDRSCADDEDEVVKLNNWMKQKRQHAWQGWKTEYMHSLMEHRVSGVNAYPDVGEIVLVVGDEKTDWSAKEKK